MTLFQYKKGSDITIVCFNFSYPLGLELAGVAESKNLKVSLFTVNYYVPINWRKIVDDVKRTRKLVIIDDGKSENALYFSLLAEVESKISLEKKIVITRRGEFNDWLVPNPDALEIDYERIVGLL